MKFSLRFAFVVLCGVGIALASDFFNGFSKPDPPQHCNIKIPDESGFGSAGYDNMGKPLCSSTKYILTDLVIDTQVGYGYNKRTQREECAVDKYLNVMSVKCNTPYCQSCKSTGYSVKRCYPVTRQVTFQAICRPIKSGYGDSYPSMNHNSGYGYNNNQQYRPSGYSGQGYRPSGYKSPYVGKIRTLKVDLPTCCQCQIFSC